MLIEITNRTGWEWLFWLNGSEQSKTRQKNLLQQNGSMPPNATPKSPGLCTVCVYHGISSLLGVEYFFTMFLGGWCPPAHGFGDELRVMFRPGLGRSVAETNLGTEMNIELD